MIYELRIYDATPGKMSQLHQRFANHTVPLWKKHGIQMMGFWTDEFGTANRLTYVLAFESLADRETRWAAFGKDPEWMKAREESERDGPLVARVTNTIMRPTPYSPLK